MSKLSYLIILWGGAKQYLLKALQVKQLAAARTVCGVASWRWSILDAAIPGITVSDVCIDISYSYSL